MVDDEAGRPPTAAAPLTAAERVLQMRDDFLALVAAYNAAGCFTYAMQAQAIVIAINEFEDNHDLSRVEWPPRPDDDGAGLKWVEQG